MKYLSTFAALSLVTLTLHGAVTPISFTGTDYLQNFNTLPSTGNSIISAPTTAGVQNIPAPTAVSPLLGWSFFNYGGTGANSLFNVDTGSSNAGATYSYGVAASTDRALGSLASGGVVSEFGVTFVNNSANIMTSFTLTYTGEEWRVGANASAIPNTLGFTYSLQATDINSGTYLSNTSLDFVSPINNTTNVASFGSGNLPANQTLKTATISNLLWKPGQTLTLRWSDVNDTGNDDGLAVDDLTFSAIAGTVHTVIWNNTGGTWDTTTANWTGDATTFSSGDIAQFTDAHVGTVNIDAGGVTPAEIDVSNTTGTYTFQGGSILGNGALIKSGAGILALNVVAQVSAVTIQGGTVQTLNNDLLPDATPVTIGTGAKLDLNGNVETIGSLVMTGGTIDSGLGQVTLGGNIAIQASPQTSFITGNLNTGVASHTVTVADGTNDIDFQIDAVLQGGARLIFAGAGTTALTADNTSFTQGVSLNTGKLIINNAKALGDGSAPATDSFFFNGGTLASSVPLTGASAVLAPVSQGGNVLVDATNPIEFKTFSTSTTFGGTTKILSVIGNLTISGAIGDSTGTPVNSGVLNKGGAGTLTLSAVNTYTGITTVQAGTLLISPTGAITSTSSLSVSNGATLQLQNAVSLGDTIRLVLVTGSIINLDFSGTETIGTLSINGGFVAANTYSLAQLQALTGGVSFTGNSGASLTVSAVPEPGSIAMLAFGLGILLIVGRRALPPSNIRAVG